MLMGEQQDPNWLPWALSWIHGQIPACLIILQCKRLITYINVYLHGNLGTDPHISQQWSIMEIKLQFQQVSLEQSVIKVLCRCWV